MKDERASEVIPFPARMLTGALLLTGVMLVAMAWSGVDSYRNFATVRPNDLRIQELRGTIVHLDEVLTMSARMAVVTGDLNWEQRYRQFEPQLNAAIKEAIELTAHSESAPATAQTDAANRKLMEMENQGFTLVRAGQAPLAKAALFSGDYQAQKKIYAIGMGRLIQDLEERLDASQRKKQREVTFYILTVAGCIVLFLFTWFSVLRRLKHWRKTKVASLEALAGVEEAMQESEERFSGAFEQAPIGVALVAPDGRWLKVNRAICDMVGYSEAELLARTFQDITHPEDLEVDLENVRRMIAGEIHTYQMEKRYIHARGHCVTVSLNVSLVRDGQGEPRYFISQIQDITGRKQAEAFLNSVLQNLPITVFIKDAKELRFLMWNKAGEDLTGYLNTEMVGKNDYDFFPKEQAEYFVAKDRETLAGGKLLDVEEELLTRHHGTRTVRARKIPIFDGSGRPLYLLGIAEDITERKQAEAELAKAQKELITASRRAGMAEVATSVLHNVGNVLNSVNVASSCLADNLKKSKAASLSKVVALLRENETELGAFLTNDPKGKKIPGYLAQLAVHLAGEQAAALRELAELQKNIEHIKDIVAMQQSFAKVSGVTETLNVADLVEDALRINASSLIRHDIQIVREFLAASSLTIEKHKVLQILVNLIRNAKHACDESGRPDKQLTVRITNGDDRVRIAVIDNGAGIAPVNLTRIFSHGFTTKKDGHGFGLHSGALAAKEMGGALRVQSDGVGCGATFTLELPLGSPERES